MQENTQLLTMGVTVSVTFIAVLAGVLLNNGRLTDLKEALRAEIKAVDTSLRAEMNAGDTSLRAELKGDLAELRTLMERQHSEVMAKLSDMNARMVRLESERRLIS